MYYKAFCPSCKYMIFSDKKAQKKEHYHFQCTCGCTFYLNIKFAKKY